MRRRTRSPKGGRGAATTTTSNRGGRGRGRARGGAKGKAGRGGGKTASSISISGDSNVIGDSVNILAKDNHVHNNHVTSSHFSRAPNGSMGYARGEHVLQLGGIPRRPHVMGPAQQNGNAIHNINNNNLNNAGNDFYLHKKFKKVTSTVDVTPSTSSSGAAASSGSSTEASSSMNSSSSSGMVYKPKFRIKSDIEVAEAASQDQQQTSSPQPKPMRALSPREKTSPLPATPAPDVLPLVKPVVSDDASTGNVSEFRVDHSISPTGSNSSSGTIFVSNKYVMSHASMASSAASAISPAPVEARKLTKEMRLDRKSLDDRISKIIDENQSILEWPEQFTKMLKNHTNRGQNSHQRTSHLLSGGSTTEINSSSLSSPTLLAQHHSHPNGLLRHSSTSSIDTPMSGGSVELLATTPHHHSLLNSNGMVHGNSRSLSEPNFKHSISADQLHFPISVAGGASSSSVTAPTDLSYGAPIRDNGSAMNRGCPSPASSTGSTSSSSTSSSSMVPKKRRRLSPTPSRLCGGEVSELPVNEPSAAGKNYFQDVDMTVRVSNCGPSGAKVTIRTNNGTVSGGSVQTATPIGAPVDFTKIITEAVPSPLPLVKPQNGSVFFPSPGPSSPSTIVVQTKPLSLVSNKSSAERSSVSPGCSILAQSNSEVQKPPKSPRGRPPRKKSVPEATVVSSDCIPTAALSSSLLRVVAPPPEIPSRPKSDDPVPKLLPPPPVVTGIPSSTNISLLSASSHRKLPESMTSFSVSQSEAISSNANATTESETAPSHKSISPVDKSENANPDKDTPFQVVPNPTQNPKRPTFLALKPVNTNSKKTDPGVLPSPETPRVAKPYNQMTINGQAYTYLGFKVSTRSSYTCLFKTQPMFIQQETDPKMSMYTNWQPRPRDPNQMEIGISTNDSRVNGRKSPHNVLYTCASGKSCDTLTVSSPGQPPISSPVCEQKTFLSGLQSKIAVTSTTSIERNASSITNMSSSPIPSSSSQIPYSQPIKVDVSPIMSSGIVPISPPSNSTSPVTFQASNSSVAGKGRLMSIASVSPSGMDVSSFSSITEKKNRLPTPSTLSSSDTNSADETGGVFIRRSSLLRSQEDDGESTLSESALTSSKGDGNDDGTLSGSRFDSPRVKIMEGGFESNEDYTYVRGRGRGRYVCEACGIRCKKPSMLRKHLKTHTDLRPYTCKLCNFSFKTKGNLTKHQKSKSHHKKCAGLGIHPESSTSLAMTGPIFSISDTNTTDDNESDDDYDDNGDPDGETDSQDECEGDDSVDGNENGSESFEKEIAQSLLDLSKATVRLPSQGSASSDYESSNDARMKSKRPGFPFGTVIEEISNSSVGSFTTGDNTPAPEIPIDLSVKPTIATTSTRQQQQQSPPTGYEHETKKIKLEKNGLIRSVGVVRKAEAWEPAEDEGIRCLNLKRVLNRPSDEGNSELPEVKTEVLEFPVANSSEPSRILLGPRQRTESETSSCSATSNLAHSFPTVPPSNEVPVQEQDKNEGTIAAHLPQPGGSSSATSTVKLHQPWLSPSEPKDKKDAAEVPAISITPLNVSPETSTKRSKHLEETNEIVQRETTTTNITLVNALPAGSTPSGIVEGGLGGVSSPNSKLFTGLSSIKPQAEFRQPSGAQALVKDEGKAECNVCGKTFSRASQLTLHMNIHYIERPFRCDPCGVSFRTKGHLIKHRRSSSHDCKVYLTEAWGVANEENPRPFKCPDCKIAFRIHGHLAKHLRSKMHIMRMECLGKLPFGIYFEMEKSGINLNEIDTTDCDMSLVSLQNVARKIYGEQWKERLTAPVEEPAA